MRTALLGDPPVRGGLAAGLADAGVEPEIAHQLGRRGKAREVADRGGDRQGHGRVDAGDGHQPPRVIAAQRHAGQRGVDEPKLLGMEVQLTQQRPNRLTLIGGQRLLGQPPPALDAEQVGGRTTRHEIAMQDRLDLVLQPRALPDDMCPTGDLPAPRLGVLVGHPHRRQIVGRQ